ncbi:hypothetical protein LINPERHAP2_LOCUS21751 [Linum perenne]
MSHYTLGFELYQFLQVSEPVPEDGSCYPIQQVRKMTEIRSSVAVDTESKEVCFSHSNS